MCKICSLLYLCRANRKKCKIGLELAKQFNMVCSCVHALFFRRSLVIPINVGINVVIIVVILFVSVQQRLSTMIILYGMKTMQTGDDRPINYLWVSEVSNCMERTILITA